MSTKKASSRKANVLKEESTKSVRVYEVPVVMTPILPDDVKKRVVPNIKAVAEKLGGKVSVKDEWGKRHLAYEIDGNEEGYYIFLKLEIDPGNVKTFEQELSRMPADILRFLVISEDNL